MPAHQPGPGQRACQPDRDPDPDQPQPVAASAVRTTAGSRRADRQPDPDLPRSAGPPTATSRRRPRATPAPGPAARRPRAPWPASRAGRKAMPSAVVHRSDRWRAGDSGSSAATSRRSNGRDRRRVVARFGSRCSCPTPSAAPGPGTCRRSDPRPSRGTCRSTSSRSRCARWPPSRTVRPIGSCPGQNRSANRWLITTTVGAAALSSWAVKPRPLSRGVPIVSK